MKVAVAVLLAAAFAVAAAAPSLTPASAARSFTEDGLSVRIGDGLGISSALNIISATATLTVAGNPPPTAEEGLVTDLLASGLTQSYNAATGVLSLSGSRVASTYVQVSKKKKKTPPPSPHPAKPNLPAPP